MLMAIMFVDKFEACETIVLVRGPVGLEPIFREIDKMKDLVEKLRKLKDENVTGEYYSLYPHVL